MLYRLIAKVLVTVFALLLVAAFIPGVTIVGPYPAVIAALILGLLNVTIKPILFVLTLPATVVTLGAFALVLNGLLFWFVASFIEGFAVSGFLAAFIGALIVSITSAIANRFIE